MITTDHQERVTRDRLDKFTAALKRIAVDDNLPVDFRPVQARAIREQIDELEAELREYETLKSGTEVIEVSSLAELPLALVKARIARGLSQTGLSELIGVPQQQVQRWEANNYSRVGFNQLVQIAKVLRLKVPQRITLDGKAPLPPSEVRRGLSEAGLPREVFERWIVPTRASTNDKFLIEEEVDARMQAIFGIAARDAAQRRVGFDARALRFKLPASAAQERTRAYSTFVDGICIIVAKCLAENSQRMPTRWQQMRAFLFPEGQISLRGALDRCWEAGIAVISLNDPVAFHGACWHQEGRTVIVLKQPHRDEVRWLFDLIHELFHAACARDGEDFVVIEAEETSTERRESQEERRANRFAALVLLDGRLQELTDAVVARADGRTERLKSATMTVAKENNLPVGLLANLLAHRLADSGENWWGTANALQDDSDDPWKVVRDAFVEHANLSRLSRVERNILQQLMETSDV